MSGEERALRIGGDVGSVFTDLWVAADDGRVVAVKVLTRDDPVDALVRALGAAAGTLEMDLRALCAAVTSFALASETATRVLAQGRTARTALLTTAGFGDTLEIGRVQRVTAGRAAGEAAWSRAGPLVPRDLIVEVDERVARTGEILQPLDEGGAKQLIQGLAAEGVEAVAVCTLWAAADPAHELRLAELAADALPGRAVVRSGEVAAVVGEHARMTTTALTAALTPAVRDELDRLRAALRGLGIRVPIRHATTLGGVVAAEAAAARPVDGLRAAPAVSVTAARAAAESLGFRDLLVVDAGATVTEAGLVLDGAPPLRSRRRVDGLELASLAVDVRPVAGGGGSVARARDGRLEVGLETAAPACFGWGTTAPTLTDADLVLGTLVPDRFAGAGLWLDPDLAEAALDEQVGRPLGLDLTTAAWGVREVFVSRLAEQARLVAAEYRREPADLTLVAGGGLGPAHAWLLARELGMDGFVVPAVAGVQAAAGAGSADRRAAVDHALYLHVPAGAPLDRDDMARLRAVSDEAAAAALERLGGAEGATVEHWLTLRYHGQARQLTLRVGDLGGLPVDERFPAVVARFESEHAARFGPGPASAEAGLEVLRVLAVASGTRPPLPAAIGKRLDRAGRRKVVFDDPGRPVETPVFTGPELIAPAQLVEGPCVLELPGCAVVVPPGSRARTDAAGNVHVKVRTASRAMAPAAPAKPVHRAGRRLLGRRASR